jgi:hypothetical protein
MAGPLWMEEPLHSRGLLTDGELVCRVRSRKPEGSLSAGVVRESEQPTGEGSVCEAG